MTAPENLARLRWACRRGMLELDFLLQRFFDKEYLQLSPAAQKNFEELLSCNDQELFDWLVKKMAPPKKFMEMIKKILENHV